MNPSAIFPLFYLPPVELFVELKKNGTIALEKFEHFPKQTYRNRGLIYSPQGTHALIVPVVRGSKVHTPYKDVRISYDFDWQRLHWLSLQTSYRRSAYFEFYEDEFARFYENKWDYLFDYNLEIFQLLMKCLRINTQLNFTSSYEATYSDTLDLRNTIHPKQDSQQVFKPYFQVFEDRHGFIPNLSVVDLLFNQGPQSSQFL